MATKKRRGIIPYKSYMFKDKDPIIDVIRTAVSDSKMSYQEISNESGVTNTTIRGWLNGNTRRPFFATASAVLLACGKTGLRLRNGKVSLLD